MGRRVWIVVLCLIFSCGAVLAMVLPLRGKSIAQARREREVQLYREEMETMGEDWIRRQKALARWYNVTLQESPEDPELAKFHSRVGVVPSGAMGYLAAEELNWQVAVYPEEGVSESEVWHGADSLFPLAISGERTVLIFSQEEILSRLEPGMEIRVGFLGEELSLYVLEPGQGGSLVLKGENTGLEVHCGKDPGPMPRENGEEPRHCLAGALGAWILAAAAGTLGNSLQKGQKRYRKKRNNPRKLSGKAKKQRCS